MVGSEHGPNDVKSMGVHGNSIEKSHGRTEKHEKRTGAMMMKNVVKEAERRTKHKKKQPTEEIFDMLQEQRQMIFDLEDKVSKMKNAIYKEVQYQGKEDNQAPSRDGIASSSVAKYNEKLAIGGVTGQDAAAWAACENENAASNKMMDGNDGGSRQGVGDEASSGTAEQDNSNSNESQNSSSDQAQSSLPLPQIDGLHMEGPELQNRFGFYF